MKFYNMNNKINVIINGILRYKQYKMNINI